jgi:hemolysin type calcium-binding protein
VRRALLAVPLVAVLSGAPHARADVAVSASGSTLSVNSSAGSLGRAIIEHFADDSRNGVRIRQIGLGDPSIRKSGSSPGCVENFAFNDIVCNFVPTEFSTLGGPGNDEYVWGGSNTGCAAAAGTLVAGNMGAGNDTVRSRTTCVGDTSGINRVHPVFRIDGSDGNDVLVGGRLADDLDGGRGTDELTGGGGNDTLNARTGADTTDGGSGTDVLIEDDESSSSLFADSVDGGPDTDTVKYRRDAPVSIALDGAANDGESGENDNVLRIENVVVSFSGDTVVGSPGDNVIEGLDGDDDITGGDGIDRLLAGPGSDFVESRDNAFRDVVLCDTGFDEVVADLQDQVATKIIAGQRADSQCERVERFAVDDGPPGRIVTRAVAIGSDGSLAVRVACPKRAKVDCRGKLRLVDARRPGRSLASARYRAEKGHGSGPVALRLSRAQARKARTRGVLTAVTRELGASEKGPRSAFATLRVRRA